MEMETVNEAGHTVRYVQADRMFGAAFFGITGLHMFHVFTGVLYLGVIAARIKKFTSRRRGGERALLALRRPRVDVRLPADLFAVRGFHSALISVK